MEKPTTKVNDETGKKKKYMKPELTKHKSLRHVTMELSIFGICGTCIP